MKLIEFCFAVSCGKETRSTYRQKSQVSNSPTPKKAGPLVASRQMPPSPPLLLLNNESLCQEIKFVSTDEYEQEDACTKADSNYV